MQSLPAVPSSVFAPLVPWMMFVPVGQSATVSSARVTATSGPPSTGMPQPSASGTQSDAKRPTRFKKRLANIQSPLSENGADARPCDSSTQQRGR
jgi:hypothetical protein